MKKNNSVFIAPRDEFGNKKIWNNEKKQYIKNESLYPLPLKIAPRDSNNKKMVWDEGRHLYISNSTKQVFSTICMCFIEPKKELEEYLEEEALNIDENNIEDFITSEDFEEDDDFEEKELISGDSYGTWYDDFNNYQEESTIFDEIAEIFDSSADLIM